jgi:SNF2 family DNA or RNA helicase
MDELMLTDEKIKKEAAMASAYLKGCHYYHSGHVKNLQYYSATNTFRSLVEGGNQYVVYIDFGNTNSVCGYECNCPAFASYNGACKHIIAVLKAIQENWEQAFTQPAEEITDKTSLDTGPVGQAQTKEKVKIPAAVKELMAFFYEETIDTKLTVNPQQIAHLIPNYFFECTAGLKRSWLEFTIGSERMYVVKDIPGLLNALDYKRELVYGKKFTLTADTVFDTCSQKLLSLLKNTYSDEKQLAGWRFSSSGISAFDNSRFFRLTNSTLHNFFDCMEAQPFSMLLNYKHNCKVCIVAGRPPVFLDVKSVRDGLSLSLDLGGDVFFALDADYKYIYHKEKIYKVDPEFSHYIKPLLKCFANSHTANFSLPAAAISEFFSTVYPALKKISTVNVDEGLIGSFYQEPLEKLVYFDRCGDGMSARIEFKYGDILINAAKTSMNQDQQHVDKVLMRSIAEENHFLELFSQFGFQKDKDAYVQPEEEATYRFLQEGLPEILDSADVYYADEFKNIKVRYSSGISAGIKLNTNSDMLELSLHYEDIDPLEFVQLLSAYNLKKKYHRMKDGTFISLESGEFQTIGNLIKQLDLKEEALVQQTIALPKYRALYLDSLMREASDVPVERNSAFKKMIQDIREPQDLDFSLPNGITGKLRDYQKTGFKWLKSLETYGLGGILADDMGLGKTLQVITFILSAKNSEEMPSLVIVPTSLVYNWQAEVQKFAPNLKVTIVSGNPEEREVQRSDMEKSDLVITSYALIKRDISFYDQQTFRFCFLDEAQHIKNPLTLTAKAVKKIKAHGYFALTGTPIENTLTELWSIFDFLMPGYLGSHKSFAARFEIPIIKNRDQQALQELSRHIKPFILRRMKKTVLKELPEKFESRMLCEMTSAQSKLYTAWLLQAKKEFEAAIQLNGLEKNRIKILSLLTRLRQICCHPALFIENYEGGSGKLDLLLELLEDAVSGNHRILLFSQFTSMLHLIGRQLERLNLPYFYLDGSTKAEDRMRFVNSFNNGSKDIFLISLKAGGTGLNLTGADMVIHFDPWWNPAVEEQATDRAYRIGQKNSVQVCKLITKNTIEEKIYDLQQKKKELIEALIKPGENFLSKMGEEEIRELFNL